jgi:hypothetical protein
MDHVLGPDTKKKRSMHTCYLTKSIIKMKKFLLMVNKQEKFRMSFCEYKHVYK